MNLLTQIKADPFIRYVMACALAFFLGMVFISVAILPQDYTNYVQIKDLCHRAGFTSMNQCFADMQQKGINL